MEQKFQKGDLVKLKIWGKFPLRVVGYHAEHTGISATLTGTGKIHSTEINIVICEWYDDNLDNHTKHFDQDLLEPYTI